MDIIVKLLGVLILITLIHACVNSEAGGFVDGGAAKEEKVLFLIMR